MERGNGTELTIAGDIHEYAGNMKELIRPKYGLKYNAAPTVDGAAGVISSCKEHVLLTVPFDSPPGESRHR